MSGEGLQSISRRGEPRWGRLRCRALCARSVARPGATNVAQQQPQGTDARRPRAKVARAAHITTPMSIVTRRPAPGGPPRGPARARARVRAREGRYHRGSRRVNTLGSAYQSGAGFPADGGRIYTTAPGEASGVLLVVPLDINKYKCATIVDINTPRRLQAAVGRRGSPPHWPHTRH
jgi:hypothetical protein